MADALILARALAEPALVTALDDAGWTALLTNAHAERLSATLAARLAEVPVPDKARHILANAAQAVLVQQTRALWEGEMMRRALAPLGVPVVLLKGSAYVAARLSAGQGRLVGDLDILVPREALDAVEAALLGAGWEWVKPDAYDDAYYRRWMHELPPLIHRERDAIIDVHHTILPLTAKPMPDAAALIRDSVELANGLRMLSTEDRVIHAAAHLLADGDLSGGLRNLWDIHCLLQDVDRSSVMMRARQHDLEQSVARAVRLDEEIFGLRPAALRNVLFRKRLLARDGWGRETRPALRFGFFVRSHLLRMPLPMLLRHLWTKARR